MEDSAADKPGKYTNHRVNADMIVGQGKNRSSIINFINKVLFVDLIKGLTLTIYYNFSKSFTLRYPDEEKWIPYRRFRGRHRLNRNSEGKELCVGCELCARSCPTQCITVIPAEDDTGRGIADRVAKVWKVNLARCMFCGLCEDACPTEALKLGRDYELACFSLGNAVKEKNDILTPDHAKKKMKQGWMTISADSIEYLPTEDGEKCDIPLDVEGGVVVKARLKRTSKGLRVVPDFSKQKRWW